MSSSGPHKRLLPEGFDLYVPGDAPVGDFPRVSILKKGVISFNGAAFGALGSPKAVQLLFNSKEKAIGLRGTSPEHITAIRVRSQSGARSYLVSCVGFLKFCDIDYSQSRRYRARLEGNMLVADLKQPEPWEE